MKFEKFLKQTGTHGQIYTRDNGDRWLICAGVGMKVPQGIVNLLGVGEVPERVELLVETLIKADTDDKVELTKRFWIMLTVKRATLLEYLQEKI